MDFVALDVETANGDMASICQIGLARFADGALVETWSSLVDPEDWFSPMNISVHGIEPEMVVGQPKLPAIAERINSMLGGRISVHHTHFDRIAIHRAFSKYELPPPQTTWLDSARVTRRTWIDLSHTGYGLSNVCERIGYKFKHHDALEDAKAAGYVLLAAIEESRLDLEAWLHRVSQPLDPSITNYSGRIERDGNVDGPLSGEVAVFTGALEIPRSEAADLAASIGCQVTPGVTKKTTLLVVGDQDIKKLGGHEKSSKHRKAEEMIQQGQAIRILCESDFRFLVSEAMRA